MQKGSPQRMSIGMTTSFDHQPLCCQNTYYKQFISLIFKQLPDVKTHPGHRPKPSPLSGRGRQTGQDWANSNNNKQKVLDYDESKDPFIHMTHIIILINIFAVCFARLCS